MSNFISKLKEISSKITNASTQPPVTSDGKNTAPNHQESSLLQKRIIWRKNKIAKPFYQRYLFWLSVGVGGGAIAACSAWVYLESNLPDTSEVLTYVRPGTITIKATDGTILQQQGEATYENLKIDQIPKQLIESFIAAEDRRFYQHQGVDYQGVARAIVSNLQARNVVEGGSTLTQQLTRIVFLDQKRTFGRKFREMILAQKIEQNLNKQQILERYLNLVYLGSGAYGVADAAWVYFSKNVSELTLPEMATIAGLAPAPSEYSPLRNKQIAIERRNVVLRRMQESGYITADEAEKAIATPLETKESRPKRLERQAHYFTDYIQTEVPKYVSKEVVEKGGLTIETTLNLEWQKEAEKVIERTVRRYGRGSRFKQAALVAIDPRSGEIKAMVGGKDFTKNQFNRATQAQRQPGSTFKTFVYSTAIAAGISPNRSYLDAPFTVDGYTPKNYTKDSFRGWMSIRDALISSINIVAVKALIDVGWEPVIEIAQKMGIESKLHPTYSLALGASEVNLLEITGAYGTLAAKGVHTKPHGITRILNSKGDVIYQANLKKERVLSEDTSAIMTWLLRGVVTNGTGSAAQLPDRQVAGKTGTSDEARDLWFIGYIPQLVTGVWLGNDDNQPTWGASTTAAYTWNRFMIKAVDGMPVEKFPPRPNKLEGRKAEIKAIKLKPRSVINGAIESNKSSNDDSSRNRRRRYRYDNANSENSGEERRSRRRRRQEVEENTPREERRIRRRRRRSQDNNTQASAQRGSATLLRTNTQASSAPNIEPVALPPAPPASRRRE